MCNIATPTSTLYNCVSTLHATTTTPGPPSHVGLYATHRPPDPARRIVRAVLGVPCVLGLEPPLVFVMQNRFSHLLVLRHSRRAHGCFFTLGDPIDSYETRVLPISNTSAAADFNGAWAYRISTTL